MRPSFTRKLFSLLILGGSLLIAFFSVSYLTLTAAVPTATLGEFTMYLERMLGVSPLTGLESGQVVNSTRLNTQPANYYQRLIGNCGAGYILSVNADGTVLCGSPVVPPLPPAFTCAARPAYANASFVDGTPAIANQAWTQIGPNCKYTCTGGFTGIDCSTPPVGNSCAAAPACTGYTGCTLTTGTPTSIGQAWTQAGPNCRYTCNAGFSGPTCAPLGASSCMSYSETWSGSGQGGNCSASIPAGFSINDNQVATGPTITLMNTVAGYSGSVTWKCIDSDPVVGTTAVEWTFAGGSCTAVPYCSATLPACDGIGCTTNLGTPTSANQDWSRNSPNCGFTCNPGYSGVNCEIAPVGGNCGTFSCFAHEQAGGWNVACWNNFKSALTAWTASGYITPAQRTQIEADGDVSWDATCGQLAAARATTGAFYRDSVLNSPPVTGRFTLDTEEFAVFGGCSVDAQVVCPALPPSPPTGLTGVAGNASVTLSWTAPSGIIGDYIIEYKTTAGAIWLPFNDGVGTGTSTNVTGLTNGISYDFRVKARNGNGDSGWSNVISRTPAGGGICIAENWGPGCGSTMPVSSPIADNGIGPWVSITNTNPGFTGSVQMRCYDGDPVLGNIAYETIVGTGSCTPIAVGTTCAPAPACIAAGHCTETANAPTTANQAWSNGGAQCGYTCSGGWSGANCDVPPAGNLGCQIGGGSFDMGFSWANFVWNSSSNAYAGIYRPSFYTNSQGSSNFHCGQTAGWATIAEGGYTDILDFENPLVGSIRFNCSGSTPTTYGTITTSNAICGGANSCAPAPACIGAGHCTQTANAPTTANQAWSNGGAQCGYTCSGGWSGANCDVPPGSCAADSVRGYANCISVGGSPSQCADPSEPVNTCYCKSNVMFTNDIGYSSTLCPIPTCGTANGTTRGSIPSTAAELCGLGLPHSSVSGSGPWTWKCGETGLLGTNISCNANKDY